MAEMVSALEIADAAQAIYDELPGLMGAAEFEEVKPAIDGYLDEMKNSGNQGAAMKLLQLFARFPAVRMRIQSELLFSPLEEAGLIDRENRSALAYFRPREAADELRHVSIRPGGTGGATSRKFRNVSLDVRRLLDVVGDTATSTISTALSTSHLAIITGVLGVIRGINKAITMDISEANARVFWELVQSHAEKASIGETALLVNANEERRAAGLAELSAEQLRESLYTLEGIRSIARVPEMPDHWYIVESFHVKE